MKKIKLYYLIAKDWIVTKYKGNNWDKFVLGALLIGALIVISKIIGFILK
jgi:hypothetical protein